MPDTAGSTRDLMQAIAKPLKGVCGTSVKKYLRKVRKHQTEREGGNKRVRNSRGKERITRPEKEVLPSEAGTP